MSFDPRLLTKLGKLARLRIEGAEAARLTEELQRVISYLDLLAAVDPGGSVSPAPSALAVMPLRPDEVRPVLSHEDALAGAPEQAGGEFVVPGMLPPTEGKRSGRDDEGRA